MNETEVQDKIAILKCPKFRELQKRMTKNKIRGRILLKGVYIGNICIMMNVNCVKQKLNVRTIVNIGLNVNYILL